MNFLAQVMATAGEAEMIDLKKRITDIEDKITTFDVEVKDYLDNNYAKFGILLQENHLMIKAKDLVSQVENLRYRMDTQVKKEIEDSSQEVQSLTTKLKETDTCLQFVKQLLDIDEIIKTAEMDQYNKRYLEAAKKFKDVKDYLTVNEEVKKLAVYKSLLKYIVFLQENFLSESLLVWNSFITWEEPPVNKNVKKLVLTINNCDGKSDVIRVLLYYDYLDYEMKLLSNKLFNSLLKPVMKYDTKLKIVRDEGISSIKLEYQENFFVDKSSRLSVIEKLTDIFDCLFTSLDVFIGNEDTFINKLGELLETDFCECFIEHCLYETIPTNQQELNEFSNAAAMVNSFNQFLKDNGFIKATNDSIQEYIKNVDKLYISKVRQSYLLAAREIYARDLHNMIKITPDYNKTSFPDDSDLKLCENILQRPICCISQSAKDLLQLIKDLLQVIRDGLRKNDNSNGIELFYTIRDIISLYCDLVPLKHSVLLKSVPQVAALYYNNCMYFAHELAVLSIESTIVFQKEVLATCIDFIEPLRSSGNSVFNSQIEHQRDQLIEILDNSGISNLSQYTEFPTSVEKSLNQCIRQLNLLQSVWHDILPVNVYCKTVGMLCSCMAEKLIESVLALADITMDTASQLTNIFSLVLNKIPPLFPDSKEVFRHVKRWSKFRELLNVLNGSLKEIDDRWADGKGPLAQEFTADQIKHLIRALFQPTDRRSALLSRIQ